MSSPAESPDRKPTRSPANAALIVSAITFVLFMAIELVIYGKGIGRALVISAIAAIVLFVAAFAFLRYASRNP